MVITKTRNNLKQPTTSKKRPETTQNKSDKTFNDFNLPQMRKKKMWNDQQQLDFDIILQLARYYFTRAPLVNGLLVNGKKSKQWQGGRACGNYRGQLKK